MVQRIAIQRARSKKPWQENLFKKKKIIYHQIDSANDFLKMRNGVEALVKYTIIFVTPLVLDLK